MERIVCWYSHGAASLVAAKRAIEKNAGEKELLVVCIHLENELQEPEREKEAEKWLGVPITYIQDTKYGANVDTVIEKTRYMAGVAGARCTKELKKQVRFDWQRPDDIHVFGMTADEAHRIDRILDAEPELNVWAPLIEDGLTKEDCFKIMTEAGLTLPKMYLLGYHNNNCVGCLKAAGAGYWNKIRVDFPEVFEVRSHQEYLLNVALTKVSMSTLLKFKRELHRILFDLVDGSLKEMKVDGKDSQVYNHEKGKYTNCVFVPFEKAVELGLDKGVSSAIVEAGSFKAMKVKSVAINTYELFNSFPNEFKLILRDDASTGLKSVGGSIRVPLRYLPVKAGSHKELDIGDCGFFCEVKE